MIYKPISRRVFSKCQAIFNKQNQSSYAADLIKESLGKYLKTLLTSQGKLFNIEIIILHILRYYFYQRNKVL